MDRHTLDELHALTRRVERLEQEVAAMKAPCCPITPILRRADPSTYDVVPAGIYLSPATTFHGTQAFIPASDAHGPNVLSITDDEEP